MCCGPTLSACQNQGPLDKVQHLSSEQRIFDGEKSMNCFILVFRSLLRPISTLFSGPALLLFLGLTLMSFSAQKTQAEKIKVIASIPPIQYIAERIAGRHANVLPLLTPGNSPITFEPAPKVLISVSKADFLITTGLPFEKKILNKLKEFKWKPQQIKLGKEHPHEGDTHSHKIDPHFWSDPLQMIDAIDKIATSFSSYFQLHATNFKKNAENLKKEVETLHNKIRSLFENKERKSFLVYHPAWGHLADRYELEQLSIERHGKEPRPKDLSKTIEMAKSKNIDTIFVQEHFSDRDAKAIAEEIGAKIVFLNPLAKNYFRSLESSAKAIANSLE
jgi:zinc transport system substrate-binding protein